MIKLDLILKNGENIVFEDSEKAIDSVAYVNQKQKQSDTTNIQLSNNGNNFIEVNKFWNKIKTVSLDTEAEKITILSDDKILFEINGDEIINTGYSLNYHENGTVTSVISIEMNK